LPALPESGESILSLFGVFLPRIGIEPRKKSII